MEDSKVRIYRFAEEEEQSRDFDMRIDGRQVPLHIARVSAFPINRRWPGHQRPQDQTELASFALLGCNGKIQVSLTPMRPWKTAVIRPLANDYHATRIGNDLQFTLPGPGFYTVELDGTHQALHIFADGLADYAVDATASGVTYFGPGLHEAGLIEMHSDETLYLDEGAVVYGRIEAKDASHIRILGHGILDNSHCKEKILRTHDEKSREEAAKGFAITNAKRWDIIRMDYCDDVVIDGITLRDSLCYNIRPVCCKNLRFENLKLIGNWRYNSDGIDMHNCEHVRIRRCFLRTYDDSICIKGFDYEMDEADMLHNGVMHDAFTDVLVEKCVIWNDWGRSLEIGAETRAREIRDIQFRDCDIIHSTSVACDVQNVDYADVHDVLFENIRVEMDGVQQQPRIQREENEAFEDDPACTYMSKLFGCYINYIPEYSKDGKERGHNRDIVFRNIAVTAPAMPASIFKGFDADHACSRIRIQNLTLNGQPIASMADANLDIRAFVSDLTVEAATSTTPAISDREKMHAEEMNQEHAGDGGLRQLSGDFKVIIYGNSIALHGVAPKIGWNHLWGMAASSKDKDFAHLVIRGLEERRGQKAAYIIRNIYEVETEYHTLDIQSHFKDDLDFSPDILIIAIGENVRDVTTESEAIGFRDKMIELAQAFQKAEHKPVILFRSPFWRNDIKARLTREAADACQALFVDAGELGAHDENKALGLFEHAGVANHPGDLGMRRLADLILDALP